MIKCFLIVLEFLLLLLLLVFLVPVLFLVIFSNAAEDVNYACDAPCFISSWSVVCISVCAVGAIDCFKCVSLNGRNPACEDPFHNNFSSNLLESPCMGGRKGRNGLFPATACLKLSGVYGKFDRLMPSSLSRRKTYG